MFDSIATDYPNVRGIIWFDVNKETDWRVASGPAALAAWHAGIDKYAPIGSP